MTTETDLLPMPEGYAAWYYIGSSHVYSTDEMESYARANVLHHTAPLQAEIEALRAEVVSERNLKADSIHACALANIRAEHLAEALRELEEREQCDEALLRQALEALEEVGNALYEGHPVRVNTQEAIAALRERIGEGGPQ